MKLITRDTDYAVRALCCIAKRKSEIVSVSNLVKKLKIPKPFLRKILQVLNRKGLLKSYKGKGGGFVLSRPANKILLTDLIKIFQGSLELSACIFKRSICPNIETCALRKKINVSEKFVISQLKSISVGSLVKEGG